MHPGGGGRDDDARLIVDKTSSRRFTNELLMIY